jgi:stage II sporulation protein P
MKRISVQWHGPRSGEALRRLLVQGRTFAALSVCSMLFFVAAGLAGMAHKQSSSSDMSSLTGFAAAISSAFFSNMLGMEMPAFEPDPDGAVTGSDTASFFVRLLTDINLSDPKSLMAGEMPGMGDDSAFLLRGGNGTDVAVGPEDNRPIPGQGEEGEPEPDGANQTPEPADAEPLPDAGEPDGQLGAEDPVQQPPPAIDDPDEQAKPTTGGRKVVFVYHSHNRESWIPELQADTKDPNSTKKNITLVGKRLVEKLEAEGVGALHSNTDYPTAIKDYRWELSYKYSKKTVTEAMESNDDLEFFFDIHRDSQPRKYTTATIDGKAYAQVFFIIGHRNPEWRKNEAFATKIHEALEKEYPGISRGIWGKTAATGNGEYNQSLAPESVIVEIGGVENTLEESYRTADALAKVITDIYWEDEKVDAEAS